MESKTSSLHQTHRGEHQEPATGGILARIATLFGWRHAHASSLSTLVKHGIEYFSQRRSGGVVLFGLIFFTLHTLIRLALLGQAAGDVDWHLFKLLGTLGVGAFYDLITALYFALPLALYLLVCPVKFFRRSWHQWALITFFFGALYLLLFGAVAEWLFWDEFGARFNFIAVDYLIYTTEVIGNMRESYPLPVIFGGLLVLTLIVFAGFWKLGWLSRWLTTQASENANHSWKARFISLSPFLLAPIIFTLLVNNRQVPTFGNTYNQELARNGLYSFFAEFRNNELNYDQFYNTMSDEAAFARVRHLLAEKGGAFTSTNLTDITRTISHTGPEKRWNVIQITVESLSAEYLGVYGNKDNLTPHLDALAEQSLFFTNFYATGTRTVRGMEALTLSLPPTPGQSIVRRPNNEKLFTLGSLFEERGYDTAFVYGGYGYFDNMNYFFSENGYRIIDRNSVAKTNVTFANVWGACDEDALRWSMEEADQAYAKGQPFFHFVMTTSNHRPYTYPDNKIDIPSHTGREGGVKYTDYAIGQFIEQARTKPWFTNTLFVIVADHCASSAGRTDLPVKKYEIPMMIYNPTLIAPQRIGKLCSQIDYAPTLLGLMNWSYKSKFFGEEIMQMQPEDERAFIASYQKLGVLRNGQLQVLKPVRQNSLYDYVPATGDLHNESPDDTMFHDSIAYYQTASYLFRNQLQGALHEP